jgi:multiple sugar transport system ATP-binding protein
VMAHVEVAAPPAVTDETRELAKDAGDERAAEVPADSPGATVVGRFAARSAAAEGKTVEMAVDTRSLHFFDPDTGLGIYD